MKAEIDKLREVFICPVTQEPFQIPVVAEDGHVYEKRAIDECLSKKLVSPMTNEPMGKTLIPIYALKSL